MVPDAAGTSAHSPRGRGSVARGYVVNPVECRRSRRLIAARGQRATIPFTRPRGTTTKHQADSAGGGIDHAGPVPTNVKFATADGARQRVLSVQQLSRCIRRYQFPADLWTRYQRKGVRPDGSIERRQKLVASAETLGGVEVIVARLYETRYLLSTAPPNHSKASFESIERFEIREASRTPPSKVKLSAHGPVRRVSLRIRHETYLS